jgi:hypothetical protein
VIFLLRIRYRSWERRFIYETDTRKSQENREILAHQFQAGKRTGSFVYRSFCFIDADLCLVGYPHILSLPTLNLIM